MEVYLGIEGYKEDGKKTEVFSGWKQSKVLRFEELVSVFCQVNNCYALMFFPDHDRDKDFLDEIKKIGQSVPFLNVDFKSNHDDINIILDGSGVLISEYEETIEHYYHLIVSDDYPRGDLPHVYACTYGPKGPLNENT